jgi:hypothetical protein
MKTRKSPRNRLEITIIKKGIRSKKVISCCFFTMTDAYRDVEKYKKNFMKFLYQKHVLKGFETRVYTDNSGKDFILKVTKQDPMVTVYHFNYAPLREKIGHIGTLGTMIRFLPLFEPGLEVVWISDIDIPDSYLDLSYLTVHDDFIFRSFPDYKIGLYNRPYSILAGTIISYVTFPNYLLYTFLQDLTKPEGKLKQYIEDQNKHNQDSSRPKPYSTVPYGIDEYFMNTIIYNYIVQSLFKIYIEKAPLIADRYPSIIQSFTDSFIKIHRKKGTELLSP